MLNIVLLMNGTAIPQSISVLTEYEVMVTIDISAIAMSDVAVTVCMSKLLALRKLGTMTNPPPTPNNPDSKPAVLPVAINRLVHGAVQNNLEVAGFNTQAGDGLLSSFFLFCVLSFHICKATYTNTAAKIRLSI